MFPGFRSVANIIDYYRSKHQGRTEGILSGGKWGSLVKLADET